MIAGNILFFILINDLTMPTNLVTYHKEKQLQEKWFHRQKDTIESHTKPKMIKIEDEVTPEKLNEVMHLHVMTIPEEQRSDYEECIKRLSKIYPRKIYELYEDVLFHYWTLESGLENNDSKKPLGYEISYNNLNLISVKWKTDKPLIVVTHGWIPSFDDQGAYSIKNTYLSNYLDEYNIITMYWIELSIFYDYLYKAKKCKDAGHLLSYFLTKLVALRLILPSNIHMIGHNLGAHTLGFCGAKFYKLTKMKIGRITGLNPKGPISIYPWETFYYLQRTLKKTDAEFVDLIHTAKAEIFPNTTGHVEFYPNRGETPQPGCIHVNFERDPFDKEIIELICSDARSYEYYNESITNKSAFFSTIYHQDKSQIRTPNDFRTNNMGHNVNKIKSKHGNFFLKTNEKSPFNKQNNE